MSAAARALLAGATGAVGTLLLQRLLARGDGTRVVTVGRTPPARSHPSLEHIAAELADFPAVLGEGDWTEAYCCLGTTLRAAGSRAAFRAVDFDGVVDFAHAARRGGAEFLGLVSSAGADPRSRNFYLRTKGEAEAAVAALGYHSLAILQPGLLRGRREEFRAGERLAQLFAPLFDPLLFGGFARYRSVATGDVASALDAAARRRIPGVNRLDPAAIEALASAA